MRYAAQRFCTGGLISLVFWVCALFCVLAIGRAPFSAAAGKVLLPVWSAKTIAYTDRMRELSKTDERYAQCATDIDACADMSVTGQLPLVADAALWFCIGGCVSALIGCGKKGRTSARCNA